MAKGSGSDDVENFILKSKHPMRELIKPLRDIILSNKGVSEHIKWNAPSFLFNGDDKITFNLSKVDCLLIIFHRGAKIKATKLKKNLFEDPTGLLAWLSFDRAMVKLVSLKDFEEKRVALKKVTRVWLSSTKSET